MTCNHCRFIGDAVDLYAGAKKIPISTAISELLLEGLVTPGDDDDDLSTVDQIAALMTTYTDRAKRQAVVRCGLDRLRSGPANIRGWLSEIGIHATDDQLRWLAPWITTFNAKDLDELDYDPGTPMKAALRQLGHYTAIGIPYWRRSEAVGLLLLSPAGAVAMPITESKHNPLDGDCWAGLPWVRTDHETALVVDSPLTFIRGLFRQAAEQFIHTPMLLSGAYKFQLSGDVLGGCRAVCWPVEGDMRWLRHALTGSAVSVHGLPRLATAWAPSGSWPTGTSRKVFNEILSKAQPIYQVISDHIVSLPVAEARAHISAMQLGGHDRTRCLEFVTDARREHLTNLFDDQHQQRSVAIDGKVITEQVDGWYCGAQQVCDLILRISHFVVDRENGTTRAVGTVLFNKKVYNFDEDYDVITSRTANWLERFLLRQLAGVPNISTRWGNLLTRISMLFLRPEMRSSNTQHGWSAGVLRVGTISVSRGGCAATGQKLPGPTINTPEPLQAGEFDRFKDVATCRLALVLIGNLLRKLAGHGELGVMVLNGHNELAQIGEALGQLVALEPGQATIDGAADWAVPLVASCDPMTLRRVLGSRENRNVLTAVDAAVAQRAVLLSGWVLLDGFTSGPLTHLRWIWLALPTMLRDPEIAIDDRFYRRIAERARLWLGDRPSALEAAGRDLDLYATWTLETEQHCCFVALAAAVREIGCSFHDGGVRISETALQGWLRATPVPTPGLGVLRDVLARSRSLMAGPPSPGYIDIPREVWDMHASLQGAR